MMDSNRSKKASIQSSKTSVRREGTPCNSASLQKRIQYLSRTVLPALNDWVSGKEFCRGGWTYKKLAKDTDISEEDLKDYFRFVENLSLRAWTNKMRVEEAKVTMLFYSDEDFTMLPFRLGFLDRFDFIDAFQHFVGVSPYVWRTYKAKEIQSGKDPLSPVFNSALEKIDAAFFEWVKAKGYHKVDYGTIASVLHCTDAEFALYCSWRLHESFVDKVNGLRIEEAIDIIRDNPSLDPEEVAVRVGLSYSYFVRQFRKKMGKAPNEWRKIHFPDIYTNASKSKKTRESRIAFDDEGVVKWKRNKGYCKTSLTLKSVAIECGFSDTRFSQYLRQEENVSFNEWISKLRFEEAKRVLINNASLSTAQVAKRIGYSTQSGFMTWFKQQTGLTPDEWRSKVLSKQLAEKKADVHTSVSLPNDVRIKIERWIYEKGYCTRRLSPKGVSESLGISVDQLSSYFYNEGFRQFPVWISHLRIKEGQRLLITYPEMQIIDVALKVGMTDVKIFRGIFKKTVGELPTKWRMNNSKRTVAEVLGDFDTRPSVPFTLDPEKLKSVESTTSQAQGILSGIFVEDEQYEQKEANHRVEHAIIDIMTTALEKDKWSRAEFDSLCSSHSIMPGYAIERINEIVFEKIDDILIEEDNDVLYVNLDYKDICI